MAKYPWSQQQDERREERRPKKAKIQTYIKPLSKKRSKENKEYQVVRVQYLIDHPICEIRIDCLGNKATEIHHSKGRIGSLLTDNRFFKSSCKQCHQWVELHPEQAKELGFSVSRLN